MNNNTFPSAKLAEISLWLTIAVTDNDEDFKLSYIDFLLSSIPLAELKKASSYLIPENRKLLAQLTNGVLNQEAVITC